MSKNEHGDIVFCPGCPAQNTFIGPLSNEAARGKAVDRAFEPPSVAQAPQISPNLLVYLQFDDGLTGHSGPLTGQLWGDATIKQANPLEVVTYDEVKASAEGIAPRLIERIGECSTVGIRADGRRYCPAFNDSVFQDILRDDFSPRPDQA